MTSVYNNDVLVDSRYQAFHKCFIIDILNADLSQFDDLKLVKINNFYMSKVSITGLIVNIYEKDRFYRIKIDDSTGRINVTLWKDQIFKPNNEPLNYSLNTSDANMTISDTNERDIEHQMQLIYNRIQQSNVNKGIMNQPKQGDLVTIRGYVKAFRDLVEINSSMCYRVQNSNEEYVEMILPVLLYEKCYSKPVASRNYYQNLLTTTNALKDEMVQKKASLVEITNKQIDDKFLSLVYDVLCKQTRILNGKSDFVDRKPCYSQTIFQYIKDNYKEYKTNLSHGVVIETLKQLEIKGRIYSCDDEFHFIPIE